MVIRVFRARPNPGMPDELAQLIEEVSIPFVEEHDGRELGGAKSSRISVRPNGSRSAPSTTTRRSTDTRGALLKDVEERLRRV